MPRLKVNNVEYYYEEFGSGDETIVFSHGLLWSGWMFHPQVEVLKDRYKIITYDHRGQGKTEATEDGYDMETLYDDTVKLIKTLTDKPVIFAGLSMGGYVGMRLAARNPEMIKKLILMETACDKEPEENFRLYKILSFLVKYVGYWPVESTVMKRMFGEKFLTNPDRKADYKKYLDKLRLNNRTSVIKALWGVADRNGIEEELQNINCPTLVIVGDMDMPVPVEKSEDIHARIKNSKLVIIKGGGHTGSIEEPQQYNEAILSFLA